MNQLRRRVGATTDVPAPVVANWTVSNLFDHIQETLGVGDFAGEPKEYTAWRMKQIGMLKRLMKYRRVSIQELLMCAQYCKAHRIQPDTYAGLMYHINEARRWDHSRKRAAIQEHWAEALEIEQERAFSDEEASRWVDMLLRATGPNREEVLSKWRQERS